MELQLFLLLSWEVAGALQELGVHYSRLDSLLPKALLHPQANMENYHSCPVICCMTHRHVLCKFSTGLSLYKHVCYYITNSMTLHGEEIKASPMAKRSYPTAAPES